jgi:hypothetical protein
MYYSYGTWQMAISFKYDSRINYTTRICRVQQEFFSIGKGICYTNRIYWQYFTCIPPIYAYVWAYIWTERKL